MNQPESCTCEANDIYEQQYLDDGRHFNGCPALAARNRRTALRLNDIERLVDRYHKVRPPSEFTERLRDSWSTAIDAGLKVAAKYGCMGTIPPVSNTPASPPQKRYHYVPVINANCNLPGCYYGFTDDKGQCNVCGAVSITLEQLK